jgi:Fic family protein
VLNLLFLIDQRLLDIPVLYLSHSILKSKSEYYRLLNAVTKDAQWEAWILYMLHAVTDTARWTTAKIKAIRELIEDTKLVVQISPETRGIYSHELLQELFLQPYCRIANLVDAGLAQRQTASVYLKKLVSIGILAERKVGKESLFMNRRLLELLKSDQHTYERAFDLQ